MILNENKFLNFYNQTQRKIVIINEIWILKLIFLKARESSDWIRHSTSVRLIWGCSPCKEIAEKDHYCRHLHNFCDRCVCRHNDLKGSLEFHAGADEEISWQNIFKIPVGFNSNCICHNRGPWTHNRNELWLFDQQSLAFISSSMQWQTPWRCCHLFLCESLLIALLPTRHKRVEAWRTWRVLRQEIPIGAQERNITKTVENLISCENTGDPSLHKELHVIVLWNGVHALHHPEYYHFSTV